MSISFLPPPSAASIPDATELVSGKIRIATSAEATAGTNDLTAMTPAKTKSVVDAAVVGGVTYQGTFDASSPADLSHATKGDLYIISVAGTYQGQTWAVGDHLLINADMGGTLDPAKIDKVDNTDSVTSVAGRTGAVTLSTADISGLATVASTGAYSDLTGAPTLATVATTGAYSDLSGAPSLATVATTGAYSDLTGTPTLGTAAAEDVGTSAGNVVQLDGTAKLPAVDGSQLTNLPSAPVTSVAGKTGAVTLVAGDISGLATVATTGAYSDLTGAPTLATVATTGAYSDLSGAPTLGTAAAEDVGTLAGNVVQLDGSARLPAVDGSQLTNLPSGASTLGALTDVDVTGAVNTNVLKYNSTSGDWEDGAVAYSEVTGTPTLATVATTGAYSDLTGTPSLATVATTGAYSDLTGTPTLATVATTGAYSDLSGTPTNVSTFTNDAGYLTAITGESVGDLSDVTITSAVDGQFLKYDSASGDWINDNSGLYKGYTFSTTGTVATPDQPKTITARLNSSTAQTLTLPTGSADLLGSTISLVNINSGTWTISAASGQYIRGLSSAPTLTQDQALILTLVFDSVWYVVAYEEQGLGSLADVSITSPSNGEALIYNSTLGDWQNGTVSASVAALNDIGDVSAASPNNGDVIAYNSTSGDWEATAQSGGGSAPSVTVSSPSTDQTLTSPSGIEEVYIYTPSTAINVNLVAAATCGSGFKYQVKNRSTNTLTIDPNGTETIDGSATFAISTQEASVTLITDGSNWFII